MVNYVPSAIRRATAALLAGLTVYACGGTGLTPPVITGIDPNPAKPGDQITISGQFFGNPAVAEGSDQIREGFGITIGGVALRFSLNLEQSDVISWDGDNGVIVAKVPADLTGTQADVVVSTDAGSSKAFPLFLGEGGGDPVVQPVIGWILHDGEPTATLFEATAAGLTSDPTSWTFSTSEFPDTPTDDTPVLFWSFDYGENWDVTLNDVSASLEDAVAYLSISATDVSSGTTFNFLRPYEGFFLENAEGDLPTGLGPVRLGDWGPVVALGIGDQTVSHINAAENKVAAVDYVELIDANFIALGVYGGVDESTGLPYTMLVGNTKIDGTAKMVVLWQQPSEEEGQPPLPQVQTIVNTDWVLNGLVTAESWNTWVVARHVNDCAEGNVYAECSGPDHVVRLRYRGRATEGTNFSDDLVRFVGVVTMPETAEIRGITTSHVALYLPYAARGTGTEDGVYMLRLEKTNGLDNVFADLLTQTVQVPDPNFDAGDPVSDVTSGSSSTPITDTLQKFSCPTECLDASFDVSMPSQLLVGEHGAVSIDLDTALTPSGYDELYGVNEIRVSIEGGVVAATADPVQVPAAPSYRPASHDGPVLDADGDTQYIYGALYYMSPANHTVYFMPLAAGTVTITVEIGTRATMYDVPCNCYIPDPAAEFVVADTGIYEISSLAPSVGIPAAMDIKKTDGSALVSDPRDVYVIPETPLVLVTSHGENRVAVINSLFSPVYMHSFPSYASGPTRLACGVVQLQGDK